MNNLENNWRKPTRYDKISAKKYNINTSKSVPIGDRLSDMIAGCKSEIHTLMHVKTGHGKKNKEIEVL